MAEKPEERGTTDVLIVGAGPVGLTLACELLRRGVRCRVIDKSDAPSETSRAFGIQSRTLEVFEDMGIVGELLAEGLKVTGANVYEGDKPLFRPHTRLLKAPYPYILSLPQSETERLLAGLLRTLGGEVERPRELVGFGQEGDGVVAFVQETGDRAGALEEIHAGWLVGCDGAHSRVRHTLGVPFEGGAYEEEFVLADVELDWNRRRNEAHAWLHRDGIFLSIPLPGSNRWRLISDVTPQGGGEAPRASVELFRGLMAERAGDTNTSIGNPTWLSNYTYSRRMAPGYRGGRAFLMGDAAHIHSPVGGQGMNTGIQDAYNLGWKLALVVRGKAPDKLLDSYEEERLPVAKSVLRSTHAATGLISTGNPVLRFVRRQALTHLLPNLDFVPKTLLGKVSELDVNYRKSSLSKSYEGLRTLLPDGEQEKPALKDRLASLAGPRAGDRAPQGRCLRHPSREETNLFEEFRGTGFVLLLFEGQARAMAGRERLAGISRRVNALLGDEVETRIVVYGDDPGDLDPGGPVFLLDTERELHEAYGARTESLCLIRPDGYVGFRGQPAREDRLLDYLGNLFPINDARGRRAIAAN